MATCSQFVWDMGPRVNRKGVHSRGTSIGGASSPPPSLLCPEGLTFPEAHKKHRASKQFRSKCSGVLGGSDSVEMKAD